MEKIQALDAAALNNLSSIILRAAITVHQEMGPGLLEAVYQQCMIKELRIRQLNVNVMVPVPLQYKGQPLNKIILSISWLKMKSFWN